MKWFRAWWVWLVLACVIAAGGFGLYAWSQKNAVPQYKTVKVERGTITASVAASGTLSPVISVQVGSQVSGQLKEVLVDFNSEVKQGQLIARIDPETFEYKVRQAQADLDAARAQVMTQQANINAQRAEVSRVMVNALDAQRDLERKQQLVDKGFIAAADRDKAQATYNAFVEQQKTASAQVAVAQANTHNAEATVKQREAVLAQARIDLERTAIKAPVNGVIIKRSVDKGQTVAASLQAPELFIIGGDLTDMQVDTAIDESEIGRIRLGQQATFTVDAFPNRSFEGEVRQIRKAALTVSNVVTYTVEVSAPNPQRILLPGMTANVRIVTDSRNDVLKVANAALRFKPATADEQKASGPAAQSGGQGRNRALRERLAKELALSADQQVKLDAIFAANRDQAGSQKDAPDAGRQQRAERRRSEQRAQIMQMLTPQQQKKYQDIIAETGGARAGGGTRSQLYVPDQNQQPKALAVRLGLSDGVMTEVSAAELKEGMDIIIGATQSQQNGAAKPAPPAGPRMF